MSNQYLEKIALTRLVKEIAKNPGKFNVKDLVRKGFIRSKERYTGQLEPIVGPGIRHERVGLLGGSAAIAEKHNATIKEISGKTNPDKYNLVRQSGGSRFESKLKRDSDYNVTGVDTEISHGKDHTTKGKILMPNHSVFNGKENTDLISAVTLRHEAHEATEISKDWLPKSQAAQKRGDSLPQMTGRIVKGRNNFPAGNHANLAVLMRESNDVRKIPHIEGTRGLAHARRETGESGILEKITGKPYGSYFSGRDIKKGRSAKPNVNLGMNNWAHNNDKS